MKIKSLGYKVTDEKRGIEFELSEEALQELIEKFYDTFQGLNLQSTEAIKSSQKESKPKEAKKSIKKLKRGKAKPEVKKIPNPLDRMTKELTDLQEEFVVSDIVAIFVNEGYDKKNVLSNVYHDIDKLIEKNKISLIEGTKPKKYKILSKDTNDLV